MGATNEEIISRTQSRADTDTESTTSSADVDLIGQGGLGARRAQLVAGQITTGEKRAIFTSIFFLGTAYGLESMLRMVYQPYATSGFANHSTLATVNVLRSVVAAAAYPAAARLSDIFGRLEMVLMSITLYILGTIVDATCHNVEGFSAGAVIYQIGYTTLILLVEVIIADITPLKSRLLYSYIPTLPFLLNTWISGEVSKSVLGRTTWRWAIGMWGIILAVAAAPLVLTLWLPYRRIRKHVSLTAHDSPLQKLGPRRFAVALFWQLDVVGLGLLVVIFAGILAPFTVAGRAPEQWKEAKIVAPLAFGLLGIPVWLLWEYWAKSPLLPFKLLTDRAVWGALGIAWMLQFCWTLQGNFLYTVLIVAFDESVASATRIASLYSFCSVLTGVVVGLIVVRVRYLKPFIVSGALLFLAAFGVLFRYRGGSDTSSHAGIIGAQVFLGFAGGFVPFPTQTAIQAATKPDNVAVITGLYLATFNIGSAFGNAVSGAIWTQKLIPSLLKYLPEPYNTESTAKSIFATPFEYAAKYPIGTPVRNAIVLSYRDAQKALTGTGLGLCVLLITFSLCIRNEKMSDDQSLPWAESYGEKTWSERLKGWKPSMLWK
ncbi:major facilitator superfamily domain-containing protein [Paraphoma chrysanthemicola]|uniref:Major facilitator superfamily domain-containing protein n=1 Tax=Paraphoma chrysanthemicola TaxID=798071 RepID=A0A8K0W4J0_9PLEO|nr:major facilitator superfamily domain-containing protein [Paraphoma chrysanthemicola]